MYTYGYLFYLPITIVFSMIFIVIGMKKKRPLAYYAMVFLAVIYINKAIEIVFFPMLTAIDMPEFSAYNNINMNIMLTSFSKMHLIFNVLLTIPIGIGVQYVTDLKFKGRFILSIALSLSFELIQLLLLFTIKPVDIIFDINDIICNVSGAILGILIVTLINMILSKVQLSNKNYDLFSYIHAVAINCANKESSLNGIYIKK